MNFIEQVLDAKGLLFRKPARSYGSFDCRRSSASGLLPSWKLVLQVIKRAIAVRIRGRLREYRFDQHVERIKSALELGHTVDSFEILNDIGDRF